MRERANEREREREREREEERERRREMKERDVWRWNKPRLGLMEAQAKIVAQLKLSQSSINYSHRIILKQKLDISVLM